MLPVPLWNLPEETDRGLGEWGCYGNRKEHTWRQSPERSREGWGGKGKEEKVYVRLQLLCFPVKWGPGKMERTEVRWQPLSGTTTSAARLHNPEKQSAPCSPGPVHSRAEERTPADQSTEKNTLHLCFSTSSVFRKQHKVRLVVSLNVKTNKDGNNLSREVSIWVPAGPQRSFVRHYSSSLVPWFL